MAGPDRPRPAETGFFLRLFRGRESAKAPTCARAPVLGVGFRDQAPRSEHVALSRYSGQDPTAIPARVCREAVPLRRDKDADA